MSVFDFYGASEILHPLILLLTGITVYGIFVFKFYTFIARKDIFNLNLTQYNRAEHPLLERIVHIILYVVEYILLFPVFTFFWFIILLVLLSLLAKDPVVQSILLFSIAIVGAVRIAAYYKEELARDLAKTIPFAILTIYLADSAYFSFSKSWEFMKQLPAKLNIILIYLIFIILLEFLLRIIYLIAGPQREEEKSVVSSD